MSHHLCSRRALPAFSLSLGLALLAAAPPTVEAAAGEQSVRATQHFDIPAGPLAQALNTLARQGGLTLSVDPAAVAGQRVAGMQGEFAVADALDQLLAGTGLHYRFAGPRTVIVEQTAAAPQGAVLSPLRVAAGAGRGDGAEGMHGVGLSRGDIERRNPASVKELFAAESSVAVSGGPSLSQKVFVNGIDENNLAVSIDGARQNNRVFHHAGTNIIDPALLKLARVDAGVAPADAGPGALGGAIVYETVDVDDLLAPGRSLGGFVTGGFASNGETWRTGAATYGRAGSFEALGYVQRAQGDDYKDGAGDTVPGTRTDLLSLLGKLAYEQDGHRVEFSAEQLRDHAKRPFRANIGA
ncbi:hypothetical protein CAI21_14340 [Alkalilimnicola ehrlichii]|uniref:Secretin/TonB short N-terminal domain-containing protein n=1 Tax=Alkalilimnicola ehrlichii TaxID=351052 RepID=A0A3E0WL84_9GAMM|nr:TonB-dependent receptor [Alkalilimnicola ehrlichii]RFA27786.1 hypothetical protein CAI21_14340 [Alkalilimnicola ehrlichii]RFA33568.1 hypothetical protein CAL65_17085 [Alkalilimnicola ehrlichii]